MNTTLKTAFLFDERCLWLHSGKASALAAPVGGWIQPVSAGSSLSSAECVRRFKSLLDMCGLSKKLDVYTAEPALMNDLLRVHHEKYLHDFKTLSDANGGELGFAAPFSHGAFELASLSAGLAKEAVSGVLEGRYQSAYAACVPAGHHALPDQSMGSTLLANSAIAAEYAIAHHHLKRVAILDWDVHHGNGTQHIFYERADVLTISLHQDNCFPIDSGHFSERGSGKGQGYNLNIPMLPGSGHDEYLYALKMLVLPTLQQFKPELIIIGSGYDASTFDVLGHMQLHSDTFREMTQLLVNIAKSDHSKLVMIHEGGYSDVYVPFCALAALEALSGLKSLVQDPFIEFIRLQTSPDDFKALNQARIQQYKHKLKL